MVHFALHCIWLGSRFTTTLPPSACVELAPSQLLRRAAAMIVLASNCTNVVIDVVCRPGARCLVIPSDGNAG